MGSIFKHICDDHVHFRLINNIVIFKITHIGIHHVSQGLYRQKFNRYKFYSDSEHQLFDSHKLRNEPATRPPKTLRHPSSVFTYCELARLGNR